MTLEPVSGTLSRASLGHLARSINADLDALKTKAIEAFELIVSIGEALIEVRSQTSMRDFPAWLKANTSLSYGTAEIYQRIAGRKDELISHLEATGEPFTVRGARQILSPLGRVVPEAEERAVAIEMRRNGATVIEIAEALGISRQCVYVYTDPRAAKRVKARNKRAQEARRALRDKQRAAAQRATDREMRSRKDAIGDAYLLIRKAGPVLDAAIHEAVDPEVRQALSDAISGLTKAEAATVKANKLTRGQT